MSFEHPNRSNASIHEVEREIMRRPPEHNTTNLDLDRMNLMLDVLGHPEESFRVIHVTGTNGKGSTARMAEAICRAYGMRTGLYTSPHLERINERIAIDGQSLSDDDFVDTWDQVKDLVDLVDMKMEQAGKPRMSFFEVLTAMAIWKFADAPVDVAVVEVGMGGAWDATNVLNADAAVIGPVDMDHMQWLGDTVEQIAAEKAGIIKPGCTAVIGPQPHEQAVMPILEEAAERNHSRMLRDGYEMEVVSRAPAVGGQLVTLRTPLGEYEEIPVAKFGEHQAHNALAALAAAEAVIPVSGQLNADIVSEALGGVKVPGRIEQVRTSPTIIIDGGHNVNAAEALRAAIEENYDFTQLVGVIAMMGDKQVEEYLGVLEPLLSHVVVTENSWRERVMSAKDLEQVAVRVFGRDRVTCEPDLPDAIQTAVNMVDAEDELGVGYGHGVLICGSFVTAGDARTMLKEHALGDLVKPKAERVNPADLTPEDAAAADFGGDGDDGDGTAGPTLDADEDFATDANPDFADSDFGIFDVAKAQAELEQDARAIVDKVSGGAKDES
ncbi:bifunctional folylpolyglutamate synthase/dihydrofolate synthase [Bifidobacterium pullorum subsp. gallinarum]|uniref:tetrahydrofolate synthase n=1 Tax=Bifidobacterium pullorum subsp. gallinarum TaxID=78344 RepID=A0A4P6DRK2_9BIFI|nr:MULTISPECIES: folylpolyglutamate synthase/dihydrofolate synthase family protein [Bifidobacterium]MBS5401006.1 bifunctional folylpolyglutamate synthase/dihydrofolate synthase [Bifidobacterium sp.]QAY32601.1 bifunctional folylpolyglutamate synthase/dihydrofolate synthase [Bifidobacterium pullorum subsp. gallinarum]